MANAVITGKTTGPCGCCGGPDPCGPGVPDSSACMVSCASTEFLWTIVGGLSYSFPGTPELTGSIIIQPDGTVTASGVWTKTNGTADRATVALQGGGPAYQNMAASFVDATAPGTYAIPGTGYLDAFPITGLTRAAYGTNSGGPTYFDLGEITVGNVFGTSCAAFNTPNDPYFGMSHTQDATYNVHCTGLIAGCSYLVRLAFGSDVEEIGFVAFDTTLDISGSVPIGSSLGGCSIARQSSGPL